MNYFRYLFSDKKARTFWIIYYTILLLIVGFALVINENSDKLDYQNDSNIFSLIFNILTTSIIVFAYPLYYSYSYFFFKIQQNFVKKYSNIMKDNSIRKVKVELLQRSYSINAAKTTYSAKINPKQIFDEFTIAELDNQLLILGQTYGLGIFRQHLRPIILSLDNSNISDKYRLAWIPKNYSIIEERNDLIINFSEKRFDIKVIKIRDWKKNNYPQQVV